MWIIALVLLAAFVVWFVIEPRVIWPGFLLTFGLVALAAQVVLWAAQLPRVEVLNTVLGFAFVAVAMVIVAAPLLVALFLCWNFVVMWRKEGLGTATKISGAVGFGGLAYFAATTVVAALGLGAAAELLTALAIPATMLALGFVCFLIYSTFYTWWFSTFGGKVDGVVVLGGALRDGRNVSPLLARRIDRGIRAAKPAWDDGRQIPMVMSGGQGDDEEVSEAHAMTEYALERGVDKELVLQEDESTNTEENLRFTAQLLRDRGITGRVAVATNDYHAFRAATMMRRAKLPGYAVGYLTARYYWPAAIIREYVAILRDHAAFVAVMLLIGSTPLLLMLVMLVGSLF